MLTTTEIERQLSKYRYEPIRGANREYGDCVHLPVFMTAFNDFIKKYDRFPSCKEYMDHYFKINVGFFSRIPKNSEKYQIAVERCNRAYPSLTRDFHLTALLKEHGLVNSYDIDTDVKGGVDQVVDYHGQKFFVHCFVDSPRGHRARKSKDRFHEVNDHHIDLPINVWGNECKNINSIQLYSMTHINQLIHKMDSIIGDR